MHSIVYQQKYLRFFFAIREETPDLRLVAVDQTLVCKDKQVLGTLDT